MVRRSLSLSLILTLVSGCELVVDFDRSLIVDGGDADAAASDGGRDASAADASVDAASDAAADGSLDAGADGGVDAGADGSVDAGADGSVDAGADGSVDAGVDGSVDAGADAPLDAGCAGPADCDDGDPCTVDECDAGGSCTNTLACGVSLPPPTLDDLSTIVVVAQVDTPMDGFVVVHEDAAGSPGAMLGVAAVAAGTSTDVPVELDRPVTDGETLHAMLHFDVGVVGTYEPGVDVAATSMGAPVTTAAVATVPAGTPAAELSVSGDGADYLFSGARPSTLALPSGSDPTLALLRGYRYRIVNATSGPHPFEFIADGASVGVPADDVVQLSESAAGALEGDADIAWSEDASGVEFTVAASFEANVDAYRCAIHAAAMRGAVTYADP